VPQAWLLQEPQPLFLGAGAPLLIPCPTSGVLPPEMMKAFQMRLSLSLPQLVQIGVLSSLIERSSVTWLSQPLHR
jgi:hypothetical protein